MNQHKLRIESLENAYYSSGNNPTLWIDCGTHGDEYGIVPLVEKIVLRYEKELPPFIFVPVVCPSGVRLKTRENENGVDLNRNFLRATTVPEVQFLAETMDKHYFDLGVTWHEDPTKDVVYFYDTGKMTERDLVGYRRKIRSLGAPLFTGFDWEGTEADKWKDDPALGTKIVEGYVANSPSKTVSEDGTFATWSVARKHMKRIINPEIGSGLDTRVKEKLIDIFFEELIIPLTRKKI